MNLPNTTTQFVLPLEVILYESETSLIKRVILSFSVVVLWIYCSLGIDNLCNLPVGLVLLEIVRCLLWWALQPWEVLWILGTRKESWLVESVWHLNSKAILLLSLVKCENEALWIVPLGMLSITPFHELIAVECDFFAGHQSCLANLLTDFEVSSDDKAMLGQDELEWSRSILSLNFWVFRWFLRNVNESLSVVVEWIGTSISIKLLLVLVEVVVT